MRRLWNVLLLMLCLRMALACGVGSDDRMVRWYAECMVDPNTTLHQLSMSGTVGTVALSSEAMEGRLHAQLSRGEVTMSEIRVGHARYCEQERTRVGGLAIPVIASPLINKYVRGARRERRVRLLPAPGVDHHTRQAVMTSPRGGSDRF